MLPVLSSLKSLVKTKRLHIDFPLFRLHYQVTVLFLLTFSLIVSTKILFGDPIDCKSSLGDNDDKPSPYNDQYCWAKGTYTVHRFANRTNSSGSPEFIHPGVAKTGKADEIHHHTYYRYVSIILLVQAVLFYSPHYLWKIWENGSIIDVCQCLQDHRLAPRNYIEANRHLLVYLNHCFNINRSLAIKYYFCHLVMLINIIIQVIWLNWLFNYQYYDYGVKAMMYYFTDSTIYPGHLVADGSGELDNPLDHIFPKVTICKLNQVAPSGDVEKLIPMCILPLNIFHDKIFLILWYWFAALGLSTIIHFLFITTYIFVPSLRLLVFRQRFKSLMPSDFELSSSLSEIFILELIGNNLDPLVFSAVLEELSGANLEPHHLVNGQKTPSKSNQSKQQLV